MTRRKLAAGVIALVVASSLGGWLVGRRITSPAEVAARTAAPEASPILVPVEQRQLTSDVVTRGSGQFGSPETISVATSALKSAPGIVADLPVLGTEVGDGGVLMTGSGRPLFLLTGEQPMARDLGPGLSGGDVRQLEEGLVRLGFDTGPVDGTFDTQTEFAVAAWYDSAGYAAFSATTEQLAGVRTRETELATARADSLAAGDSVATANEVVVTVRGALATARNVARFAPGVLERAKDEANAANTAALLEVAQRQTVLDGLDPNAPPTAASAQEVAAARSELASAQAAAAQIRADSEGAVAEARSRLETAPAKLAEAEARAAADNAVADADVATAKAELDAVKADPNATPDDLTAAQSAYEAAVATAEAVRATGEVAVGLAREVLAGAQAALDNEIFDATTAVAVAGALVDAKQSALDAALTPRQVTAADVEAAKKDLAAAQATARQVAAAGERSVAEAEAALASAQIDVDTAVASLGAAENAYAVARRAAEARGALVDLAQIEADLAKRTAGVQVPADELVFVSSGPIRVSEVLVGKGDSVVGGVIKATNAEVYVVGGLAVQDAGLVTAGMEASIDEPDLGIAVKGTVTQVATAPGTNGQDAFHVYFEVRVESPPANLVGASVRVTIPVESTAGASLVVPLSALTLAPDGSSRVQRSTEGTTVLITVNPGLSADGFVEITPVDGELEAGDLVVIGFTPPAGSAADAATSDTAVPDSATSDISVADSAVTETTVAPASA